MKLIEWVNDFVSEDGLLHTWVKDKEVEMLIPSDRFVIGTCGACQQHGKWEPTDMCKSSEEDFGCIHWSEK
tara:strand:- start:2617 stop:2829 length:213 start_codon:yes stop_codon:yes gene_type:complete